MGLSTCAASAIGSLTQRHFYGWKGCNRVIREKTTEEENLRKKYRRRQANNWKRDRKKIQGIEKRKEMNRGKRKIIVDVEVIETDGMSPAGQRTQAVHDVKKWYKEINYKLSPTPYSQGGCLCLYHYQGSQNKHFPNAQFTPMIGLIHFPRLLYS